MTELTQEPYSWWQFIEIGDALRYLEHVDASSIIDATAGDPLGVLGHLQILRNAIDDMELKRSHRAAGHRLTQINETLRKVAAEAGNVPLGQDLHEDLVLTIRDLRRALQNESQERSLFPVLPSKEIPVESLLIDPEAYFNLPVGGNLELPNHARLDFIDAATCFAAGFFAPAIVFAFRGTEALLRAFFEKVTGNSARFIGSNGQERWKTWACLCNEMKAVDVRQDLIDLLNAMRLDRNEAMHAGPRSPDKWDFNAACKVFENCRKAVLRMTEWLRDHDLSLESG